MAFSKEERLAIFSSLFKGRTDVFARRWEKWDGSVSGYAPVYTDWSKKNYVALTGQFLEKHLVGEMVLGLYPMLQDNTSHFIAADFDGEQWSDDASRFASECKKNNVPVYLERSRSGNGVHVWCFFEDPYPAYKSRSIFLSLLRNSKNIDDFAKEDSFDRLFPNQDYLSGKGLGNLIALPLQGKSRKDGNSVFLKVDSAVPEPHEDQWQLLAGVEKISTDKLDSLYADSSEQKERKPAQNKTKPGEILITLSENLSISRGQMNGDLITFLREKLNFFNADYSIKQKIGLPTYDIEKYFKTVRAEGDFVIVPRGFLGRLEEYLKEQSINYKIEDKRNHCEKISLKPSFNLFEYQKEALEHFDSVESGVLVAPPGSGKTIMGLELIARKKQSALIITHRKQIYTQWLDRIESFLGIPKKEIGQFVSNKKTIKVPITVAMIQSLSRQTDWEKLKSSFGAVIVDECHHVPAKMFREVVTKFNPQYLFGFTATPKRKGNDEKLIYAYLGDIVYEVHKNYQSQTIKKNSATAESNISRKIEIIIRETKFSFPFIPKIRDYQTVAKVLIFDSERNRQIANDISLEAKSGKRCLVLTERKEHVELLNFYLKRDFETIAFTSEFSASKRKHKEKQIQSGNFQILIATGQIVGEGSDIKNLDCLFLVFPFSFEGKLIQYIGRIERGEERIRKVYDYRDNQVVILESMFKKRKRYYNKL